MTAYYNENNAFAAAWLRRLIAAGDIPCGVVDERDIRDVSANELVGFTQWHFFAGIGGFPLACRIAGWPDSRGIASGGFPCQDISSAGKGAGIDGDRSGLWGELRRMLRTLRPGVAIMENSTMLLSRGLGRVLGDLAADGFDAEWDCISAREVGAEHERDRIYILSYPHLQHGETGLGVLPIDEAAIREAHHRYRQSIWLQASCPAPSVVDGLSVHLVRRPATEGFGNAIVPQVAAEVIRAYMEVA